MAVSPPSRAIPPRRRSERQSGLPARRLFLSSRLTKPAKITYGKQRRTKPLALDRKQFRASAYDLLSDDEDDASSAHSLVAGGLGDQDGSDVGNGFPASSLSDSEQDAVEVLRSPFLSNGDGALPFKQADDGASAVTADSTVRRQMVPDSDKPTRARPGKQPTISNDASPVKQAHSKPNQRSKPEPAGRLPVNELFLVASPPRDRTTFIPVGNCTGITAEDPIENSSSLKRTASTIHGDDETSSQKLVKAAPLTELRRKIRATTLRHKSLKRPRRPATGLATIPRAIRNEPEGRDGFEKSELVIRCPSRFVRKPRLQTPLIRRFGALQLRSGPLPDVEFVSPPIKAEMQTQLNIGHEAPIIDVENDVESDNRRLEERIRAELSSISAPPRPRSETDYDEDEDEEDEDLKNDADSDDDSDGGGENEPPGHDGIYTSLFGMDARETDEDIAAPEGQVNDCQTKLGDTSGFTPQHLKGHDDPTACIANTAVTLDFRRPEMIGQASISRSLQRRKLMEINESIVEVPDTTPATRYTVQRLEHLGGSTMHERQPRRVRSILKYSTPAIPDSTSAPERTEANTRRNSMAEVEECRYFANATHALRDFDPARHIVMPRCRSAYFDHHDVEVPHSDHVVPDTSPSRLRYTNDAQLYVLRRTSEATWTSAAEAGAEAKAPRDLKTLTRTVSKEHGTLSQSVRRRPSLPFQSPAKIH